MDKIQIDSIEDLLNATLTDVKAVCGKVAWSFDELIGSALELASAETAVQSVIYSAPDDDDDENQPVNDALSLREDVKFDMGAALDRTLNELAQQQRVINATRTTLEQIREALQLRDHELSLAMEIGPKPGCGCAPTGAE